MFHARIPLRKTVTRAVARTIHPSRLPAGGLEPSGGRETAVQAVILHLRPQRRTSQASIPIHSLVLIAPASTSHQANRQRHEFHDSARTLPAHCPALFHCITTALACLTRCEALPSILLGDKALLCSYPLLLFAKMVVNDTRRRVLRQLNSRYIKGRIVRDAPLDTLRF